MAAIHDIEFEITTSLRNDSILRESPLNTMLAPSACESCQFHMLSYHRDRMLAAAHAFSSSKSFLRTNLGLEAFCAKLHIHLAEKYGNQEYPNPLKVRAMRTQVLTPA